MSARTDIWLTLLAGLAIGCGTETTEPPPIPTTCNGSEALCARTYDAVAYATTHNAMSNADEEWVNPNQTHGITRQLDDGVRALMLDTHYDQDEPMLCHGICRLGQKPLVDGLAEIEAFLRTNRGEVVTIIFESYISAEDTAAAFDASGLSVYVRAQSSQSPWPTLRELIDADERLIVFTDADSGGLPWHLHVWDFAWETHFSNRTADEFSCDPNRGNPSNRLFILNHFLTRTTPSPDFAEEVNANPLFLDRALECMAESGALPNFPTVDFYTIGDTFAVVDALNGL